MKVEGNQNAVAPLTIKKIDWDKPGILPTSPCLLETPPPITKVQNYGNAHFERKKEQEEQRCELLQLQRAIASTLGSIEEGKVKKKPYYGHLTAKVEAHFNAAGVKK